jgi:quercetin dioxygenase-like cupin family protein
MTPQADSEDIRGAVLELGGLVDYQPGSIVSRTLMKKDTGTVTLFAFDRGEHLSEHTAPFDAMASVIEGEAEIVISGVAHRVGAGQMIVMPANESHAVKAAERFKMMLVMIRS